MKYIFFSLLMCIALYVPLTFTMDVDKLTKKEHQRWLAQHILLIMQHQVNLLKSQDQLLMQIKSLQQSLEQRLDVQDERLDLLVRNSIRE